MKLFQSQNRQGFLVQIDMSQISNNKNGEEKLLFWLEENHNQIFWDIEAHDGGSVRIDDCTDGSRIVFSGDNGIFELHEIQVETIKF